ncbi:hypothetical protein DBR36_05970 [Microbacterium sp. HMWF026]|uniref:hypothetical protein n=1 Tax=Microbacterium sp. HMWF026 TaxID=2056861 RepID=UPI000D368B43|nr:hypothetical protein [Microbacterium sp. HMWF026]PTT20335.1 hypothetical protein DBR36_05970 [Microbacterium sp. HMWF026]
MTRPHPLPADLPELFHVSDALQRGATRGRLRASDLAAPFNGVRSRSLGEGTDILDRCRAYAPRLAPGQFFSHETVFALRNLSTPEWPYVPRLHVSTHRPAREPRTRGIVGHRLQARETAVEIGPGGLPIENAVRAWRQCGRLWRLDDLVAGADALLGGPRPMASVADLEAEVAVMGDVRDGILRRSLALARPGVRSPRETHLRLLLVRHGFPEPEVNVDIFSTRGDFVAEIDLAFEMWRVAVEYDGRVHATDPRQFERDADRWAAIRDAGWNHIRILSHHLRDGGEPAVAMVRAALMRAGWRPGQ